jgi:hypothetical protein
MKIYFSKLKNGGFQNEIWTKTAYKAILDNKPREQSASVNIFKKINNSK